MLLMNVVIGDCLVETLDWLALYNGKVHRLLKTLFNQIVHPSEYIHSAIILYTNQYYHSSNETKCTFEPCIHYCHIHLACTSVRYEKKMHELIIERVAEGGLYLPLGHKLQCCDLSSSAVTLLSGINRLNPQDKSRQLLAAVCMVPLASLLIPFTGPKDPAVHLNGLTGIAKGLL